MYCSDIKVYNIKGSKGQHYLLKCLFLLLVLGDHTYTCFMIVEIRREFIFGVIVLNNLALKSFYLPHILCQLLLVYPLGRFLIEKIHV